MMKELVMFFSVYRACISEANDRAAELGRDLIGFRNNTQPEYVESQEKAIRTLRSNAMYILDVAEGYVELDMVEIKRIRNQIFPDVSKTLVG